jgi:hypothetical protein
MIREKRFSQSAREMGHPILSFRFMEPLEEAVYLDQVRVLAVDHPADLEVYPNEYFASNPPYPEFKVVVSKSKDARPPAGAWDEHGHDVLPDLLAHRYFGDFALTQFQGFAQPHSLTLDLGEAYRGGPLWLLLHGEVEYFSANSMYAASQAGVQAISPYVEALGAGGKWVRVIDDMGFPRRRAAHHDRRSHGQAAAGDAEDSHHDQSAGLLGQHSGEPTAQDVAREIPRPAGESAGLRDDAVDNWASADSSSAGRRNPERSRSSGGAKDLPLHISPHFHDAVPLVRADLGFHGFPAEDRRHASGQRAVRLRKGERDRALHASGGNLHALRRCVAAADGAGRSSLVVFGSGDEVRLDFDPAKLPALPEGWVRDYFFAANGYEKDMDFYAAEGDFVAPLPFLRMGDYPYEPGESFPLDDAHVNYLLEYNTRHMSGNEQRGYWFDYGSSK